jgi:hypothetical protein
LQVVQEYFIQRQSCQRREYIARIDREKIGNWGDRRRRRWESCWMVVDCEELSSMM